MSTLDKKTMDRLLLLLGGFTAVEDEGEGRLGVQVNHFIKQHDIEIFDRIAGKKTETLAKCADPNVAEAFAILYQHGYKLLNELEKLRASQPVSTPTPVLPRRFWFTDENGYSRQEIQPDAPVRCREQIQTVDQLFVNDQICECGVEMFVGNKWVPGDIESSRTLVTKRFLVEIHANKECASTFHARLASHVRTMTGVVDPKVIEQP